MGKLLFIDMDDVTVKSACFLQGCVDRNTPFKTEDLKALDDIISNCNEIYNYTKKECEEAFQSGRIPNLLAMVSANANDIIRGNDDVNIKNKLYVEPVRRKLLALNYAKWQKEMFLERRDHFLEMDNLNLENGAVDYNSIYVPKNINDGVIEGIKELNSENDFEAIYQLSHHNGGREELAKRTLNKRVFPNIPFLGLRFHLDAYKENQRRPRSSKAMYVMQTFALDNLNECYLIDDSTENIKEWIRCGGKGILYKPFSEAEKISGVLEPTVPNSARIFEFSREVILDAAYSLDSINKVYVKK